MHPGDPVIDPLARALVRVTPAVERLEAAYREAVRGARPCRPPAPEAPVSTPCLPAVRSWRRAYDALCREGARPLRPDGSSFELEFDGRVVRVDRAPDPPGAWSVREAPTRPANGPLLARFPWLRMV